VTPADLATPPSREVASSGPEQFGPSFSDQRLEDAIESTRQAMLGTVSRQMKQELAEQMKQLIGQRSPWMIAKMERDRGLAP
jgi:hypothetical protein